MSVDVLLTTGKWFEVPDGVTAKVGWDGALVIGGPKTVTEYTRRNWYGRKVRDEQTHQDIVRWFGPAAWVTWDETKASEEEGVSQDD